jgi:GH35 family endo-1,4-beta-xylanase
MQSIQQYATAENMNMNDVLARLSQSDAQLKLKDGTLVIVDPATADPKNGIPGVPLFIYEKGGWKEANPANIFALIGGRFTISTGSGSLAPNNRLYRDSILPNFSGITPDWDFQWQTPGDSKHGMRPSEDQFNFTNTDFVFNYASQHDFLVIAQPVLPQIPQFIPPWLEAYRDNKQKLGEVGDAHIRQLFKHYPNLG